MNGITPQLAALLVSTGVGVWMAVLGVHKNALEWRRRQRTCPSCGHVIAGRTCTRHF
jgi:hypothetical protein